MHRVGISIWTDTYHSMQTIQLLFVRAAAVHTSLHNTHKQTLKEAKYTLTNTWTALPFIPPHSFLTRPTPPLPLAALHEITESVYRCTKLLQELLYRWHHSVFIDNTKYHQFVQYLCKLQHRWSALEDTSTEFQIWSTRNMNRAIWLLNWAPKIAAKCHTHLLKHYMKPCWLHNIGVNRLLNRPHCSKYVRQYLHRPHASVGEATYTTLEFLHTRCCFAGYWNSRHVHVRLFLAPHQQYWQLDHLVARVCCKTS